MKFHSKMKPKTKQDIIDKISNKFKVKKAVAPVQLIAVSFLVIIAVGTILLMLPFSQKEGGVSFVDALFISTSATCITGLSPFDTFSTWTPFGQGVILALIQFGALGLMTFATFFAIIVKGKLSFRSLQLAQESTSANIVDIPSLIKVILSTTLICEGIGAILLSMRFVPQFGTKGIWISIFTSVSAYCNAGFDIFGFISPGSSLLTYQNDSFVLLVVSFLIILGGLGFVVMSELYNKVKNRLDKKKVEVKMIQLSFHSKVVIVSTLTLLIGGTVLFYIGEYRNTLIGMDFGKALVNSFFQSTAARTAGFNSVPIALETSAVQCLTIFLMFVGASPGSTGGGVKTTTFAILIATVISVCRGYDEAILFKRRIRKNIMYRSLAIVFIAIGICIVTTSIVLAAEHNNPDVTALTAVFETVSAFGTVGLSANVTGSLSNISKYAIIVTMFIGRIGPLSMALVFNSKCNNNRNIIYPEGSISVG